MNRTTTELRLTLADLWRIHERQIRDGAFGAAMVVVLMLIHSLLRPAEPAPLAPVVMREVQRPAILVMTATPEAPQPSPTPIVVIQEVYIAAPTLEPVVEYIEVPVYVQAAPETPQQPEAPPAAIEAAPAPAATGERGR